MVGDTYAVLQSVAGGSYLEIKPSAGQELIIHNIFHPGAIELRLVDGSGNECSFFEEDGKNLVTNMYFHLTNSQYLRVYNGSGGAMNVAVDGIVSKE